MLTAPRRLEPTEVGAAPALRCAEVVRLAEDADRAVTDAKGLTSAFVELAERRLGGTSWVRRDV